MYRRYAGLFFCVCVDSNDNELAYLEAIHLFVEVLGQLSCSRHVCTELMGRFVFPERMRAGSSVLLLQGETSHHPAILFSCDAVALNARVLTDTKVYAILDEVFLAGEIEETSKQVVLDRLDYLEKLE